MAMLAMAFGLSKEQAESVAKGEDVLGQWTLRRGFSSAGNLGKRLTRTLSRLPIHHVRAAAAGTVSSSADGIAIEMAAVEADSLQEP